MLSNRCPHKNCNNLKPIDAKDCGNHGNVCACGKPVIGASLDCPDCKRVKNNERLKEYRRSGKRKKSKEAAAATKEATIIVKAKAYKPPTDAWQRRLDKEVDAKMLMKSGYTQDKGRRLTPSEIAAIAHTITPIHMIPDNRGGDSAYIP